ncbi:uncharacterized protein LOC128670607 [Plodia interpunctella]|uniref:uncharacterized protein LOC128670607 n=1 Tax=Plodia interpunctella TaxID=58824 RepID=UPI002367A76A|nr:uncharacterized protein LOC128670607 [Plodia interpunctella]
MASDLDDFVKNVENLKSTVRKSFARLYAALKARELRTLRQLDAICKQCEDDKDFNRNCVQNIEIHYSNELTLLDNINKFGVIDLEKLNFNSNTFILEDYISPNDDHMYSYKTIEDVTKDEDAEQLEAIEEAALKEVTRTDNCVCHVNIHNQDVSKKFRDLNRSPPHLPTCDLSVNFSESNEDESPDNITEEDKSDSCSEEVKKNNPTDDWLNSIKSQIETEPAQADAMEHSTITCS